MATEFVRPSSRSAPPSLQRIPTDDLEQEIRRINNAIAELTDIRGDFQQAKTDLRSATDPESVTVREAYRKGIERINAEIKSLEQEKEGVQCELVRRQGKAKIH